MNRHTVHDAGTEDETTTVNPGMSAFGPMGAPIAAFIDAMGRLTADEVVDLAAAWYAARSVARIVARSAAWDTTWDAARSATWEAVWAVARSVARSSVRSATWDAVVSLVVLDLAARDRDLRDACETLLAPARTVPALAAVIDQAWEHAEALAKESQ